MMTIRNIEFFGFLFVFVAVILGIGTHFYLHNRRRELYPYGEWNELLKRLAPIDHQNLERIASDPAALSDHEFESVETISPEDAWRLLGGMRGIEIMEKNCSVLVDLVFYVQQWYPEALLIAEQLRLNAREVEWHIGRLKATAKSGRPPVAATQYLQQAVAIYYQMTLDVLALYEQANMPGLSDLQRAL